MNIEKILIIIIIIYLIIKKNKETFAMTDQISQAIKEVYNTDMESIRKLSDMAISLQNGGLTIPGNLTVTGKISTLSNTFNLLPSGIILSYNSTTAPSGWALCDGTNGTPDLRGRFILGTGQGANLTNRTINGTGGAETHTLSWNEMPSHTHTVGNRTGDRCGDGDIDHGNAYQFRADGWGWRGCGRTTSSAGSNYAHNNMPPYYVLTFIMKL